MKKIKLGYFTHTNITPSETFIYDLVKGLNAEDDIDLTFVSGKNTVVNVDFELNSVATGFSDKNKKLSFFAYKIGQILGNKGYIFKQYIQSKSANSALNKANLPNFDVAYIEYATSGVLLMEYFITNNIPFILHVHGYDITAALHDIEYSNKLKKLFNVASKIITPSHHLKRYLFLLGCENEKIEVVYPFSISYGIREESWLKRYSNPPTVTFLGRLTAKKNPIALLCAFEIVLKKCPSVTLNILGTGDLMDTCKIKVEFLGIEKNVKFYGVVNREIAFEVLNKSWICAQHSVTSISGDQEGFPVSLAEAAAHALPIVSTIHSGITENISDGKTGFLVQEYNYEAMAEKIIYLIENPDIAEQMGKRGREHIEKICAPEKRIKSIKELLYLSQKK